MTPAGSSDHPDKGHCDRDNRACLDEQCDQRHPMWGDCSSLFAVWSNMVASSRQADGRGLSNWIAPLIERELKKTGKKT